VKVHLGGRIAAVALAVGASCTGLRGQEGDIVTLAEHGRALAEIVLPAAPTFLERRAAAEVSTYLGRITGGSFPIVTEGGSTRNGIFIGQTRRALGEFGQQADSLGAEGFLLSNDGRAIIIVGGGDYGTLYGAYEFLERCGVRWYAPGELGQVVPQRRTLSLPSFRERARPAFRMRWVGTDTDWNLRNKTNRVRDPAYPPAFRVEPGIYHTQHQLLPVEEYFPEHPEYFALIGGKRSDDRNAKLCYGNPDVARVVAERMAERVRADPSIDLISFSPTDGQLWCECDLCRALDEPETAPDQRYSRRSLVFYNRLAEHLREALPQQEILVGAYNVYNQPPRDPDLRAQPNLSVIITHYDDYCMVHSVDDPNCPLNERYRALIRAWQERGVQHVYFYEYYWKANWFGLPWPIVHSIRRDIPYFASIGTDGLFTQYQEKNAWTYLLNYYVAARLLWDPATDVSAVLDEFYRLFYGPAEEPMRAYYETLERAISGCGRHFPGNAFRNARYVFTPDLLAALDTCLRRAEERAVSDTSGLVARRVAKARLSYEYTCAAMDYLRAGDALDEAATEEGFRRAVAEREAKHRRLVDLLEQGRDRFGGVVAIGSALRYLRREPETMRQRLAPERTQASRLGLVNEWLVIGPFDNKNWEGHERAYPPEREVDLEASYSGKDGRRVGWRRLRTQPWDGYVDLERFFGGEEWAVAYALCWAEAERPLSAEVRVGSNDSAVMWIGGRKVHDRLVERAAILDEDIIRLDLPQGRTPVLLKIGQSSLSWGFYFRITDADGKPLDGVRFTTQP